MATKKKPAGKAAKKRTASKKPSAKGAKGGSAFMKPLQPSESLAKVVGSKALPRTEVVKKVWDYIRKNKLQDSKNRRNINADEALRSVFGGKKVVDMFEMARLLNKNLS